MAAPLASMTGAGSAAVDHETGRFEAEIRSVNHRFLKTSVRTHGPLPTLDRVVEDAVRADVARGHVSVFVRFTPSTTAATTNVDVDAFAATAAHLRELAEGHDLLAPGVGDVLRVPGVIRESARQDPAALLAPARETVAAALASFLQARRREGALLTTELETLLSSVDTTVVEIDTRAAAAPEAYRDRIRQRLTDLLEGSGADLDPAVLAREVAVLADRTDVREELARLRTHLVHIREVLAEGGAAGRRLDFLVQELHRETNTIGSKASDAEMTRLVVDLKTDVERLREQVQNIE